MNLTFNSIHELDEFLRWADLYRMAGAQEPVVPGVSGSAGIDSLGARLEAAGGTFTAGDGSPSDLEARDMQMGPYDPALVPPAANAALPPAAKPARRKRRTAAEIEADEQRIAADVTAAKVADDNRAEHGAEAAAAYAQTSETAPTGANPFEQPVAGGADAPATPAETAPAADVSTESDAEEVVTPFQHITRAKAFIAKHGMPKYNETFAKASLDPNVMAYTAYQRALHMTAMDELDKA